MYLAMDRMNSRHLDRRVGAEALDYESLFSVVLRLLRNDHPYYAWRLIARARQVFQLTSADLSLLQAKALELMDHPQAAVALLFKDQTRYPNNETLAAYLLQLLEPRCEAFDELAWQQASAMLLRQDMPDDILRAVRILKRLQGNSLGNKPIGACRFDGETLSGWLLHAEVQSALNVVIDGVDFSLRPFLAMPLLQAHGLAGPGDGFAIKLPVKDYRQIRIHLNGQDLAGSPIRFRDASEGMAALDKALLVSADDQVIDIIVPVYKGLLETQACLQSVLSSQNRTAYRLVVIDDASPEASLSAYLQALADKKQITLLKQAFNTGFVEAVSRGLALSLCRDVVLLNADTLVHGDWLDRLHAAAYADRNIGTVTPLSNNGELLSYPVAMKSIPMPAPDLLKKLDDCCAVSSSDGVVDIPVGVGFCLYIKRQCLTAAGGFDGQLIERGYGDDTDFCLRAAQQGWRNVCTPRVFVGHAGSVSFGAEKAALVTKNIAKIYAKYPEHSDDYNHFLQNDPLYPVRQNLQRQMLPSWLTQPVDIALRPAVRPGDVHQEYWVLRRRESQRHCLWLQPIRQADGCLTIQLQSSQLDKPVDLRFVWPKDRQLLAQLLTRLDLVYIDIHDLADWPWECLQELKGLQIPYRLFLNDYAAFCPRIRLTQPGQGYCEAPEELSACLDCINQYGSRIAAVKDVSSWRQQTAQYLSQAQGVYLASEEALCRYQSRFPEIEFYGKFSVRADEGVQADETKALIQDQRLRIGVLQAATLDEGFEMILALARLMAARQLDAELIVLGDSKDDAALMASGNAWVIGPVAYQDIADTLSVHHCSLLLDAACWPQIEPIAWQVAQACRLPLAAAAIGAYTELLKPSAGDIPLNPRGAADDWLTAILDACQAFLAFSR